MSYDAKVNLESLLYSNYIKYDRLKLLIDSIPYDIESNKVDIYIDVYDMLKPIYTRDVYAEKKFLIVSQVINLAAHMRGFFWTRYGIATRIYLVYGEDITTNHRKFYQSFGNDKFKDTVDFDRNNAVVNSQLDMVRLLCAYIHGVYFIRRSTNFSMFTYDNISKNQPIPSIIITKDKYAYQIPALLDNVYLLRPRKTASGDESYIIYKRVALISFFNKLSEASIKNLSLINPELLSLLIALTGFPSYNLKTVCNITTASKMVINGINTNRIINAYNTDIDYVYNQLSIDRRMDSTTFKFRFNAVDLVYQHRLYNSSAEARDISWIIDLEDKFTIQRINNQYFIDNSLDLNNL
jgi:hypothetical protein